METKDDAVAMDYKDIEKFIQEKKMNDVTLVPIYQDLSDKEHTLEERFIIKVYSHLKNEIKKFVKTEKKKDGDHFSKDKCFRFIYKDPDNTDDHAYCFIFGCSGGKPYIITQKTTQDTKVLATMYNDTDVKRQFEIIMNKNLIKPSSDDIDNLKQISFEINNEKFSYEEKTSFVNAPEEYIRMLNNFTPKIIHFLPKTNNIVLIV